MELCITKTPSGGFPSNVTLLLPGRLLNPASSSLPHVADFNGIRHRWDLRDPQAEAVQYLGKYMTRDLSGYNQFVRVTRRTKRQREKAYSPVVQVVQLESPLERLSDCSTVPYLRFFLVRNEEVVGSNPLSSTIFQSDLERAKQSYRSTLGLAGVYCGLGRQISKSFFL